MKTERKQEYMTKLQEIVGNNAKNYQGINGKVWHLDVGNTNRLHKKIDAKSNKTLSKQLMCTKPNIKQLACNNNT